MFTYLYNLENLIVNLKKILIFFVKLCILSLKTYKYVFFNLIILYYFVSVIFIVEHNIFRNLELYHNFLGLCVTNIH